MRTTMPSTNHSSPVAPLPLFCDLFAQLLLLGGQTIVMAS
jgi:hypothetical protein